jgi:Tfp pilus assembly protein PilV
MGTPTDFRRGERGFTLIETLAAAFVLLIGVMSTLALLDRANKTSNLTASREAGTSLARDLVEAARSIPFEDLNSGALNTKLQAVPGLDKSGPGPAYTIERRNVTFTITDSVCTMDDGKDGGGPRPSSVDFCAQSVAANTNGPNGKPDRNPEDYKLVTIKASWTRNGVTRNVTQTGVVNNPGSATGPSVTALAPDGWTAPYEVTSDPASLTIKIQTSSKPTTISWSVDGTDQSAVPTAVAGDTTGLQWSVPWTIHPAGGTALDDGPYQIEAQAFNQYSVSGPGRTETILLNRFPPRAPTHVAGGYNALGGVDIEWDANTERDIIGYDVRRSDGTMVCALATQKLSTSCTDSSPPSSSSITYLVRAYDSAPGTGAPRASSDSSVVVTTGNTAPFPPPTVTASTSGNVTTLTWARPIPSDLDLGDSVVFYRIYRDGTSVSDRYDRWYSSAAIVNWQDTHTGGTTHRYWVSSVDQHLGESTLVGPVSG